MNSGINIIEGYPHQNHSGILTKQYIPELEE